MPTITKPNLYFDVVTYTGTGATQTITGLNFQPDFVWIKNRTNGANWHVLTDAVRGVQKEIYTNSTAAEATLTTTGVNQFNSNGFQILGGSGDYNRSGDNYVAWCWKANGSGSTNTSGSITSTVSANTTSGFSIATYTGNGTTGTQVTVGHGLGVAPKMVIVKDRSNTNNWVVYTTILGSNKYLYLNLTDAAGSVGPYELSPTSSVFYIQGTETNASGHTYVAYSFAEVAGYSKFGSYTGNGSSDGPFVYCGFRPAFVMLKRVDATGEDWFIYDATRNPSNATNLRLEPNLSDAEVATANVQDILSNGFKIRNVATSQNASGINYIFAAFASTPFKYSLAR